MLKPDMKTLLLVVVAILAAGCESGHLKSSATEPQMPFGGPDDVSYAGKLWQSMLDQNLVGPRSVRSTPYKGMHPHGAILDTIESTLVQSGHNGEVIVKKNFGGEGISKESVADNPDKWLMAVTVMYKREAGYDAENRDWFWVKYAPDGSVMKNPKGMALAGRVAKGMSEGCIACHTAAPGGDLVYNHDRYK